MVINALSKCLEDPEVFVRKTCLDFLLKYIDVNDKKIFSSNQIQILFDSVLLLFIKNDLSIFKRISKLFFKENDLKTVNLDQHSDSIRQFTKSFNSILVKKVSSSKQCKIPFLILSNLSIYNPEMMTRILNDNAYDFFYFCYQRGFKDKEDYNSTVLEFTKSFIKTHHKILNSTISYLEKTIKNSNNFKNIDLLSFILKFIILDLSLEVSIQLKFIISLLEISADLIEYSFIDYKKINIAES